MNVVRITSDSDVDQVTELINKAIATVARQFGFTGETVPTFPAFIDTSVIRHQVQNGLHLYAHKENDHIIGCVGYKKYDVQHYLVERLAADPANRHMGIGTSLMNFITEKIAACGGSTVEVQIVNENLALRKWYLDQGFSEARVDTYTHLSFTVGVLQRIID